MDTPLERRVITDDSTESAGAGAAERVTVTDEFPELPRKLVTVQRSCTLAPCGKEDVDRTSEAEPTAAVR
jgi:hypothetical protein